MSHWPLASGRSKHGISFIRVLGSTVVNSSWGSLFTGDNAWTVSVVSARPQRGGPKGRPKGEDLRGNQGSEVE